MDNGQVIPGLSEDWTFLGAKLMEWISGFAMALIFSELFTASAVRSMPILLLVGVGTPLGLAALRKRFPDEERGIRNSLMVAIGIAPPGIPAPSAIQPIWSGAPIRFLREDCEFQKLHLEGIFRKGAGQEEIEIRSELVH